MTGKKSLRRRLGRLLFWAGAAVLVLLGAQIALLAFPQVFLSETVETESVVLYHRGPPDPALRELAEATDHRIRAGGFGSPSKPREVFFFRNQQLYSIFARLARVPAEAQGFEISLLGSSFVSGPRVEALGSRTGNSPRYGVWEGSLSHTMAHEIGHLIMVDSIGRSVWATLPQWKREGFPEYIANEGLTREDPSASLQNRIGILLDDGQWLGPRSWDRVHYEAWLLVEYLLEKEGHTLRAITSDKVTRDETYDAMMEWYRAIPDSGGASIMTDDREGRGPKSTERLREPPTEPPF